MNDLSGLQKREKEIRRQLDEAYRQQDGEKVVAAAKCLIMLAAELIEK